MQQTMSNYLWRQSLWPSTYHHLKRSLYHCTPLNEHRNPIQGFGPLGCNEVIAEQKSDKKLASDIACQDIIADPIAFLEKLSDARAKPAKPDEGQAICDGGFRPAGVCF
jgi:hypothetical protein